MAAPIASKKALVGITFAMGIAMWLETGRSPALAEARVLRSLAAFGLLHGLGFGGALKEIGLPQSDVPLALFTFNLGGYPGCKP